MDFVTKHKHFVVQLLEGKILKVSFFELYKKNNHYNNLLQHLQQELDTLIITKVETSWKSANLAGIKCKSFGKF